MKTVDMQDSDQKDAGGSTTDKLIFYGVVIAAVVAAIGSIVTAYITSKSAERTARMQLEVPIELTQTAEALATPPSLKTTPLPTPQSVPTYTDDSVSYADILQEQVLSTHIVEPGDTFGEISAMYGVSVENIMNANAISNTNFLAVGQEIVIPRVVINDFLRIGTTEAIVLQNPFKEALFLKDWSVSDEMGHVYRFDNLTIFGDGGAVLLHTGEGQDSSIDLFWNLNKSVWESGKVAVLRDPNFHIRSTFRIP